MEWAQKKFPHIFKDLKAGTSATESPYNFSGKGGVTTALSSSDQSRVLMTRPPRQMVSLYTCSKLCTVFFVAGVVVGYTLKKRVRSWASKLLKRLKDD
ncbi:uncharacterized protein LOC110604284 [Manihot esculenta]|uniref:Uncharacterized protein n=1 Tax=Manihot esculenta TaxID=3983 RepID=A0A251J065_MANES|nr:uncharacterized protein LOC110604284 [Manihot esculenta]OAY27002.1 hypothetical protein MANES_16G092000v8 [Manihot esculenta]